jgi:hypothetical protein
MDDLAFRVNRENRRLESGFPVAFLVLLSVGGIEERCVVRHYRPGNPLNKVSLREEGSNNWGPASSEASKYPHAATLQAGCGLLASNGHCTVSPLGSTASSGSVCT